MTGIYELSLFIYIYIYGFPNVSNTSFFFFFGQDQVKALVAKAGDPKEDKEMAKALQKAMGKSNLLFFLKTSYQKTFRPTSLIFWVGERCCT